jgi:hypothetical protein
MRGVNWVVALVGLGLSIGVHADAAFGPLAVLPAAKSFSVGKLKLTALHDAQYVVPNDGTTGGGGGSAGGCRTHRSDHTERERAARTLG